jgi:hypothetical protein
MNFPLPRALIARFTYLPPLGIELGKMDGVRAVLSARNGFIGFSDRKLERFSRISKKSLKRLVRNDFATLPTFKMGLQSTLTT